MRRPVSQEGERSQGLAVAHLFCVGIASAFIWAQPTSATAQSGLSPGISNNSPSLAQPAGQARVPILLDRVVAVVNNDVIVESELRRRLNQVRRNLARPGQALPP